MDNEVKKYCWACGYECDENSQCTRPYSENNYNCKESIYCTIK